MALANLFSSPPGEVDFNNILTSKRLKQPYKNSKTTCSTSKNENLTKKKRKIDQSTDNAWKKCEYQRERKFQAVPFKYEEDQTVDHQNLVQHCKNKDTTLLSTQPNRLGPNTDGGLKNEQNGKDEGINRREHLIKKQHRKNTNDPNERRGQDRNGGETLFEDKKNAMTNKSHRNTFNQRAEAGSKKGRQNWQQMQMGDNRDNCLRGDQLRGNNNLAEATPIRFVSQSSLPPPRHYFHGTCHLKRSRPKLEERKPFMSQEFKEQNSIDVNGRLICKHFLREKCLKGDQCQFEHSHDLGGFKFNEVCKFYVQGFCMRGDHCLYMHSTFPCKFFYTGKGCFNHSSCRFSHDPLTEFTKGLLDKLLEEQRVKNKTLECETPEPEREPAVDLLANIKTFSFYSTATGPGPEPVCRFSFGANNAEFQPEHPISTPQPAPSTNHTDSAVPTGVALAPDSHAPLVAQLPTTLPSHPGRAAVSISPAPPSSEDVPNIQTEKTQSPTAPDSTPSVLRTLFNHLSPCRSEEEDEEEEETEEDASSGSTDTVALLGGTRLCAEVHKQDIGIHSNASTSVPDEQLSLKAKPWSESKNLAKEPQKDEDERVEPVVSRLKPVPCSTPITNPHRMYRPLAVDLSPLPPLPLTTYQAQLPPQAPWDRNPGAPPPSTKFPSQEAVRQHAPLTPGAGTRKTLVESQGRHSLPVQALTWSVSSKRTDQTQSTLRNISLNTDLEPR